MEHQVQAADHKTKMLLLIIIITIIFLEHHNIVTSLVTVELL